MNSPFAWPGGKRALTPTLLTLIPDHQIYVEVFAGSAKLLFAKQSSKFEVLNDVNGEITNFFRVCKHRPAELTEMIELECIHAGRFRELSHEQPSDELGRALQFAYLTWYSFGSQGKNFAQASATLDSVRRPITRIRDLLADVAKRLAAVQIETQEFSTILRRYDSANTFFYLDPPYVEYCGNGRYKPLHDEQRETLFDQLSKIKGKFLLSFDDHPKVRTLGAKHHFQIRKEQVQYTMCAHAGARKKAAELLISNYLKPNYRCAPSADRRGRRGVPASSRTAHQAASSQG